jgi:hypothetical protein
MKKSTLKTLFLCLVFITSFQFAWAQAPGNTLDFDGTDDYVSIPQIGTGWDELTIETWIYLNQAQSASGNGIFNSNSWTTGDVHFQLWASGIQLAVCGSTENTATYTFSTNKWYHLAATYSASGNIRKIYVNGELIQTLTLPSVVNVNLTAAQIGAWTTSRYFNGKMDEYRIWSKALTQTEIQDGMHMELSGSEANLQAYYKFDHSSGTSLTDGSLNGYYGTLVNFALSGTASNWVASEAMCPIALNTTNVSTNGFIANWNAVSDATGYYMDIDDDIDFSSPLVWNLYAGNSTSYSVGDLPLTTGSTYYYRVRAGRSGWISPNSSIISFAVAPNAITFNGSSSVTCGAINTPNFTVEAWANTTVKNTDQAIISTLTLSGNSGLELHISIDNKPCLSVRDGSGWLDVISPYAINIGEWNHIAGSFDGATAELYVNGELVASKSVTSYTPGTSTLYIGRRSSGSYDFNGSIDECRVWSSARSQSDIQNSMHTELVGNEAELKAYYRFNQNSGTTLIDATSNYNGTINGTATWIASGAFCPIDKNATNVSEFGFTANWNSVYGSTMYVVDVDDNSDFSSPLISNQNVGNGTTFSVNGLSLAEGTTYYYRLRANVGNWTSPNSSVKSFMLNPGNALGFDGSNDFVDLGTLSPTDNFSTGFTFMAWVKWGSFNTWSRLLDIGNGAGSNNILIANPGTNNSLHFDVYNGGSPSNIVTGNILPTNRWVHVAATISSAGQGKIYIDGVEVASGAMNVPNNIVRANGYLGKSNWAADAYLNASMDEVSIWAKDLSESEIQSYMSSSLDGNESSLYIYYDFNQGVAGGTNTGVTTLYDKTLYCKNGTFSGFGLSGTTSNWVESYALVVPKANAATQMVRTSFTANWSAATAGTVEKYLLDVSTSSDFATYVTGYNSLDCGTNTSQQVSGLTANTTYYYRVRAEKASVTGQGAYSNTISVTTSNAAADPTISWSNPADIVYGTPLSSTQLNATVSFEGKSVEGTFDYLPALDNVMNAGSEQDLTLVFSPTDTENFNIAKDTVKINVLMATPVITWADPEDIVYGTPLSNTQLNATASHNGNPVAGTFSYSAALDSVMNAGASQELTLEFTPTDALNFNIAKDTVKINVLMATPVITWADPADIV